MRAQFFLKTAVAAWVLVVCLAGVQVAQVIPEIKPSQESVVLFDFRISKWLEEAKAGEMDISQAYAPFQTGPLAGFKLAQIDRIYGSASFPEEADDLAGMLRGDSNELPFEIFVQIQFDSADSVEKFEASVREYSKVVELGGKEFLQSKGIGPKNFVCRRFGEKTFELGTSTYCQQNKRVFLTERLKQIYRTVPDESLRIAIDLKTPSKFVRDSIDLRFGQVDDPVVNAYIDIVGKVEAVIFSHSLSEDNLLTIRADAGNAEDAEAVTSALESALGAFELSGLGGKLGLESESEFSLVVGEILSSLEAVREGNSGKIEVARPKGLFGAVNEALATARRTQQLNRFRQLGLACLNFEAAYGQFPFNYHKNSSEELSWRVKVLPFVDEIEIYEAMDLKVGPEADANAAFSKKMPAVFGEDGELANVCWISSKVNGYADITDGTSNTVMLIETPKRQPWLNANPLNVEQAVEMVAGLPDGEQLAVVFYDGAVRTIDKSVDKKLLRWLFEPGDGNEIPKF